MVTIHNATKSKLKLRFGVFLRPGDNEVDLDAWAKCKDDPITRHYLSNRRIWVVASSSEPAAAPKPPAEPVATVEAKAEPVSIAPEPEPESETKEDEVTDTDEGDEPTDPSGLTPENGVSKMKAKQVIAMVDASDEAAVLRQMLTTETRPTVRAAIERRLDELKG
jgi:hypothetical protein